MQFKSVNPSAEWSKSSLCKESFQLCCHKNRATLAQSVPYSSETCPRRGSSGRKRSAITVWKEG